jgi:outer membrane protein assembly factor BamB
MSSLFLLSLSLILMSCSSPFRSAVPQGGVRVASLATYQLTRGVGFELNRPQTQKTAWQWRDRYAIGAPQQSFVAPIFLGGDDVLVMTLGGGVQRLNLKTGRSLWNREIPIGVAAVPAIESGFAFVAGGDAKLRKIRLSTGKDEWVTPLPLESFGGVRVSADRVFATAMDDSVSAVSVANGQLLWTYRRPAPEGNIRWSLRGQAQPLVSEDGQRVYLGFSDGVFVSLNSQNGETIWERNFSRAGRFQDADVSAVFADQGRVLLVPVPDGDLLALSAKDGTTLWSVRGAGNSSPHVDGAKLWTANSEGQIQVVDVSKGQVLNSFDLSGRGNFSAPTRVGPRHLAYTTSLRSVFVMDDQSGEVVWEQNLGRGTLAPPSSDGRRLLVLSSRNQLLVFRVFERQGS